MVWFVRVIQKAEKMHVKAIRVNTKTQTLAYTFFYFQLALHFILLLSLFFFFYLSFIFYFCVCHRWSIVMPWFRRSWTLFCSWHCFVGCKVCESKIAWHLCKCSKIYAMDIAEYAKLFKCTRRISKSFK